MAITTLPSAITPAIMKMMPSATIQPHLACSAFRPSPRLLGAGLLLVTDIVSFSLRNGRSAGYTRPLAVSLSLWDNRCMTEQQKTAPEPRAAAVRVLRPLSCCCVPPVPGEPNSALEVFMVVRHQAIDSFSGALVFPGGKLEDADGDARLRARCGGADKIAAEELKFRVAGVREAFEECGILLARKRGERAVIAAADLKGIEDRWRKKLAKDEATIVDLVEAEDLELATDMMVPYAHWITPTFAPKRFDTWFFLAEAPEDQIALHDGSESVDSVWIGAQGGDRRGRPPASAPWCTPP